GDIDRNLADQIEPVAVKEAIGLNLESDEQVARRLTGTGRTTLTFETDAGPGFGAGGNRDEDLTLDSGFPGAMTDRARCAGDLAAAPALGTRPADREAPLTEGHGASAVALGAGLQLGALS